MLSCTTRPSRNGGTPTRSHVGYVHAVDKDTGQRRLNKAGSEYLYNESRVKRATIGSVTLYHQTAELTQIRKEDSFWGGQDVGIGRGVLRRLDRARNAFFKRVKAGETPGYPRFKSGRRWKTIDLASVRSGMVKAGKLKVKGLPCVTFKDGGLPASDQLKSIRITRAGRRVTVSLGYEVEKQPLPDNPAAVGAVGIDFGVKTRVALSTGELITMAGGDEPGPDPYPAADHESAEIPISGTPIPAIAAEGVTPDVAESPQRLSFRKVDVRVTPDVAESPNEVVENERHLPVTPDVAESPRCVVVEVSRCPVTPDVAESPKPRRAINTVGLVTPDVAESPPCTGDCFRIQEKQQRLSRCRKGSRRWRRRAAILSNAYSRKRVSNRNECHRITSDIIQRFGHIGVEALKIKNMTRSAKGTIEEPGTNVAAKSGLNRSILANTWGIIRQQLSYKAEWAGRRFVEVDPRYTSQTCSQCGVIDRESRKGKVFHCRSCGHHQDADHNAAINILRKSLAGGNSLPLARESA